MLSQLGTCKQCGQPYTYRASVDSYLCIMCKTRRHFGEAFCDSPILPAALFEAMTLDVVDDDILLRPNLELALDQLRESSGTLHTDKAKRAEKIRESVADYDRRIVNAYLAWENEDIGYEFFTKRTEELRNLKAKAMEELQKLEEDLDDTYVILNNPEAMLDYSAKLKTFLRDEQPTSARRWLRTSLKRFWIEKGYVTYEYRLPLPPDSTNGGLKKHTVPLDFDPITRSAPVELDLYLRVQVVVGVLRLPVAPRHPQRVLHRAVGFVAWRVLQFRDQHQSFPVVVAVGIQAVLERRANVLLVV